jgi:tetratricopeptide (TPR) repeat protein
LLFALLGCASTAGAGRGAGRSGQLETLSKAQLVEIANALAQTGDTIRAEQYYATALRQGGDRSEVLLPLLRLYVRDGQYRLAIEHAEDQLRRQPRDVALRLLLGTLYAATGQMREAVAAFEQVLRVAPRSAEAHFALATALREAHIDLGRADEHFRAYLAVAPEGEHAEEARSLLLTELP